MKFKNYYYLDKTVEPFSYIDLGSDTKISGSNSGVSINKDLKLEKGFKVGSDPSKNPKGDSFRIDYQGDYFGRYLDALVIEKTDGNDNYPDGGIAFVNTSKDNSKTNAFVIRGNGNVGVNTSNPSSKLHVEGTVKAQNFVKTNGQPIGKSVESCTIRYGGCDGAHWGRGTGYGNEYFDRLGGSVNGVANCNSDEYLKGFGIARCNSGRGLQVKMNCCKR